MCGQESASFRSFLFEVTIIVVGCLPHLIPITLACPSLLSLSCKVYLEDSGKCCGLPPQLCERKIITNASLAIEARLPLTLNNHTSTPRATPRTVRLRPPGVELEGYRIYGTPWQPAFFGTVRGSTRAGKTGSAVLAAPLCCHPLPHDVAARHIPHEACVNTAKHEANEANAT